MQTFQQFTHSCLLGFGAGVGRPALSVQAAFVADTDAVVVTILAVSTNQLQRTALFHRAIATDNVMVAAAVLPPPLAMPAVNLAEATLLPGANR